MLQGQLDGHQLRLQRGAVVTSPGTQLGAPRQGSTTRPATARFYKTVGVINSTGDLRHGHEGVLPQLLGAALALSVAVKSAAGRGGARGRKVLGGGLSRHLRPARPYLPHYSIAKEHN